MTAPDFGDIEGSITRKMLVDAIVGRGLISYGEMNHYRALGLAWFIGGMGESSGWNRDALDKLPSEILLKIYLSDKK